MRLKVLVATSLVAASAHAGDVALHVTGASGVLSEKTPAGWVGVCNTPCDAHVDASGTYRFFGPPGSDVNASNVFVLPPASRVDLAVRAGLRSEYRVGVVLLVIGGAVLAAGIGFVVGGYVIDTQSPGSKNGDPYQIGGVIGIIAGVVTGGLGLVHMLNHRVSWLVVTPNDAPAAFLAPRAFTSPLLSVEFQ